METTTANLPAKATAGEIMETVLIKGDLSKLTSDERVSYYKAVCDSVGINALTKPFEYITLNGTLQLYALKGCTDQLRSIHDISVTDLTKETIEGVHIVTAKVRNGKGRTDADIGAVNIAGLRGEHFANAIMKASTKAKRRATLSICGLGMLDEIEIEDIPSNQRVPSPSEIESTTVSGETKVDYSFDKRHEVVAPEKTSEKTSEKTPEQARHQRPKLLPPQKNDTFQIWSLRYMKALDGAQSTDELKEWDRLNDENLEKVNAGALEIYKRIMAKFGDVRNRLMRSSISTGKPVKDQQPQNPIKPMRSDDCPNAEKEPDAFISWAAKRMAAITTATELDLIFEQSIEPATDGLTPPDYAAVQAEYEANKKRLGGD